MKINYEVNITYEKIGNKYSCKIPEFNLTFDSPSIIDIPKRAKAMIKGFIQFNINNNK